MKKTKSLKNDFKKCMVCVVCCETFVKIFLFFLFLGEFAEGRGGKQLHLLTLFKMKLFYPLFSLSARPQVNEEVFFCDWKKK
jgi:hypothetical protein